MVATTFSRPSSSAGSGGAQAPAATHASTASAVPIRRILPGPRISISIGSKADFKLA